MRTLSVARSLIILTLATACLQALGCGENRPERVPVSGRVLIDGEPLEQGFIQVVPEGERAATAQLGEGGRFALTTFKDKDGCVPGTHQVAVISNESQGPTAMKWHAPKMYADASTSGLTLEVTEATKSAEIQLTWDGGQPFVERFQDEGGQPE